MTLGDNTKFQQRAPRSIQNDKLDGAKHLSWRGAICPQGHHMGVVPRTLTVSIKQRTNVALMLG